MEIIDVHPETKVLLPQMGSWPGTCHVFDEESLWAIKAAVAAERPLLVRGEPGSGKSQLARAAAHQMGRLFISEVVHSRSECQDLQYRFDSVARLGEANALAVAGNHSNLRTQLSPLNFLSPGSLWWTFNWDSAEDQYKKSNKCARKPITPSGWGPDSGSVLLVDEIDKADADLPNGLLETLGNGAFSVPYLDSPVMLREVRGRKSTPLVVITTNEERELPAAFLRRCMVLHMNLPRDKDQLAEWLCRRGEIHFGERCSAKVRFEAARQLIKDRMQALEHGLFAPGQAEYLDLLRALCGMAKNEKLQLTALKHIRNFALMKHTGEMGT